MSDPTLEPSQAYIISQLPWVCLRPAGHRNGERWVAACAGTTADVCVDQRGRYHLLATSSGSLSLSVYVDSISHGKAMAEEYHRERLLPALTTVDIAKLTADRDCTAELLKQQIALNIKLAERLADASEVLGRAAERRWCPDKCPITRQPFFMWIEKDGVDVPTYGGPFDSYTIPEIDDADGSLSQERFDHDGGYWVDGCEVIDHRIVSEQAQLKQEEIRERLEAENKRLSSLLANAYTVKPLDFRWDTQPQFFNGWWVERNFIGMVDEVDGEWRYRITEDDDWTPCESFTDGKAKVEAWHTAKLVSRLNKIEVPA